MSEPTSVCPGCGVKPKQRHWDNCPVVGDMSQPVYRPKMRCAQCGRVGVRGFKQIGPLVHEPSGFTIEAITVCANENACRKRWPQPTEDEMDAHYA